jgi:hypothetical protein
VTSERLRRVPAGKALELQGLLRKRDRLETSIAIQQEVEGQRLDARLARLGFAAPRRRRWPREPSPVTVAGQVLRHSYGEIPRIR